jgi:hypothetical protein
MKVRLFSGELNILVEIENEDTLEIKYITIKSYHIILEFNQKFKCSNKKLLFYDTFEMMIKN